MKQSLHICPHCDRVFTCTPPQPHPYIYPCLADDCISYDPARDTEIRMGYKKEPARH